MTRSALAVVCLVLTGAVQAQLRFYSYGDCMLILPQAGRGLPDKELT